MSNGGSTTYTQSTHILRVSLWIERCQDHGIAVAAVVNDDVNRASELSKPPTQIRSVRLVANESANPIEQPAALSPLDTRRVHVGQPDG